MAVFHYLRLRAFAHATEDPERVRQALRNVAGDPKLAIEETRADGSHGNTILILEAELRSAPAAKALFGKFALDDPEGLRRLRHEGERRLDEELVFHFRLDKQEAYLGRLALSASDDAVVVRAKVRAFESRRSGAGPQEALQKLDGFLGEMSSRSTPMD